MELEEYLRGKLAAIPAKARRAAEAGKSMKIDVPLSTKAIEQSAEYRRVGQRMATQRALEATAAAILRDPSAKYALTIKAHMYQAQPESGRKTKRQWSISISIH